MLKSIFILFAGILEEKIFEADPNIKYTFAWDRMNIYRQRVYGVTTANIKVQALCFSSTFGGGMSLDYF
jgi:hypothetical protein